MLTSASGGATFAYDPLLRLRQVAGAATTKFGYDGLDMIAEADASNAIQRRYVFGPGDDEPLVQYEGAGITDRRWLHADERGSVVAISDATGSAITINRYDEYGKPQRRRTLDSASNRQWKTPASQRIGQQSSPARGMCRPLLCDRESSG